MDSVTKQDLQLRYEVFQKFALEDQGTYYRRQRNRSIQAERGVNRIRATIALFTGIAAAIAATLGQAYFVQGAACHNFSTTVAIAEAATSDVNCVFYQQAITIMIILSIALPSVGGFFSSLADLYQWERLSTVYETANRNLVYADALSPDQEEPYEEFFTSYQAYVEGALQVMSDETKQWGQSIRKPEKTEQFIEEMRDRAERISQTFVKEASENDPNSSDSVG